MTNDHMTSIYNQLIVFFIFLETNTLMDDQDDYQVCTHIEFYYNVYIKLYTVSVIAGGKP
jgi:phosphate starvation-inducible membrane PsiE